MNKKNLNWKGGIMRVENYPTAKVFTIFDAPRLDPITVIIQDVASGKGRLTVECFGSAWSGFWGATGCETLIEFITQANPGYIAGKMHPTDRKMPKHEVAYLQRIIDIVHTVLKMEMVKP
jgi:hypothetical protein